MVNGRRAVVASVLAGGIAGGVEGWLKRKLILPRSDASFLWLGVVTYPLEFVKTQSQLAKKAGSSSKVSEFMPSHYS